MEFALSKDGRYRGVADGSAITFKGICYGTYSRFKDSVPYSYGNVELIDATMDGAVCPQRDWRLAERMGNQDGTVSEEGRLCLSVCVPKNSRSEKYPVMIWIHGGSYRTGGSENGRYSASRMVTQGQVIVVKISFRMGAHGFLWLPELGIGNQGLKDQILALKWVKDNIEGFGGDASRITLFGQSSGAWSVAALISRYSEVPIFRKAILQSPPLGIKITEKEATHITAVFLKKLRKISSASRECSTSQLLQSASISQILDAQKSVNHLKTGLTFMPVIGDVTVPGNVPHIDVMLSTTGDEAITFVKKFLGIKVTPLLKLLFSQHYTRSIFKKPCTDYCARLRKSGLSVREIEISWKVPGNPYRSCHSIELPFLLGEFEDWSEAAMLRGITREEFDANSRKFIGTWTDFAKNY